MAICKSTVAACLLLFVVNVASANNNSSIDFYASNNSKEINIQTAYERLTGTAQSDLQNSMINILQKTF